MKGCRHLRADTGQESGVYRYVEQRTLNGSVVAERREEAARRGAACAFAAARALRAAIAGAVRHKLRFRAGGGGLVKTGHAGIRSNSGHALAGWAG